GDGAATLRAGPGRGRGAVVPRHPDLGEGDGRADRGRPRSGRAGDPGRVRLALARPPRRGRGVLRRRGRDDLHLRRRADRRGTGDLGLGPARGAARVPRRGHGAGAVAPVDHPGRVRAVRRRDGRAGNRGGGTADRGARHGGADGPGRQVPPGHPRPAARL
ncbi:MAG: hypothetical protein AVDCRST_MAG59-2815, partial [uncultured Thermomicrobiales bacterium]